MRKTSRSCTRSRCCSLASPTGGGRGGTYRGRRAPPGGRRALVRAAVVRVEDAAPVAVILESPRRSRRGSRARRALIDPIIVWIEHASAIAVVLEPSLE